METLESLAVKLGVPELTAKDHQPFEGQPISKEIYAGAVRVGTGATLQDALTDAAKNGPRALKKAELRAQGITGPELVNQLDAYVEGLKNA